LVSVGFRPCRPTSAWGSGGTKRADGKFVDKQNDDGEEMALGQKAEM